MRLYFFASSQCGTLASLFSGLHVQLPTVSSPSTHSLRLDFTTQLSSAHLPSGTSSYGILGIWHRAVMRSFSACAFCSSRAFDCSFISATRALAFSAASLSPAFISFPISAAAFFCSASRASFCCCVSRRRLSMARTLSIASRAPLKFFFSRPLMTRSYSSVISFSVSILLLLLYFAFQNVV